MPIRQSWRSSALAAVIATLALLAIAVPQSLAATRSPASLTITSVDPATGDGGAYNFNIGLQGPNDLAAGFLTGPKTGHCIEAGIPEANVASATLRTGTDLVLQPGSLAAASNGSARLHWILLSSARSRTATTGVTRDFEAAAHQLAVWLLTTPPNGPNVVADDPAVLVRAQELVAQSVAGAAAVTAAAGVTIVGTEACGQTTRTVRVTGAPWSTATVRITSGQGALTGGSPTADGQQTAISFDQSGSADLVLTSNAIGQVRLSASITTHDLVQVDAGVPQDFAYLEPRVTTYETVATFTACVTPPPVIVSPPTPTTPVPTGAASAKLAITKTAARTARAGSVVTYTIRVRNTSTVAATGVTLTDAFPSGTSVVNLPRGAKFVGGKLVWTLGTLAPKASTTVRLKLRFAFTVRTRRCNVATTVATNAPQVSARVCTGVVAGQSFLPGVTG